MAKSNLLGKKEMLAAMKRISPDFSDKVCDLEQASEERSIREAEVGLSSLFLMNPGTAFKVGMSRQEESAMASMIVGRGYVEMKPEPDTPSTNHEQNQNAFSQVIADLAEQRRKESEG